MQAQRRGLRQLVQTVGTTDMDLIEALRLADPNPGNSFAEGMEGIATREKRIYGVTV